MSFWYQEIAKNYKKQYNIYRLQDLKNTKKESWKLLLLISKTQQMKKN